LQGEEMKDIKSIYDLDLSAKCDECGGLMEYNYSEVHPAYKCMKCGNILEV